MTALSELADLLGSMESLLFNRTVVKHGDLRPGLSRLEVEEAFREVDIVPPADLVTFYSWHDGALQRAGSSHGWITPKARLAQLGACIENLRQLRDLVDSPGAPNSDEAIWFPFLSGTGWFWFFMDCSLEPTRRGRVAYGDATDYPDDLIVASASLVELVDVWLGRIDAGVWEWKGSWIDHRERSIEESIADPW